MTRWTHGEVAGVRAMLDYEWSMTAICTLYSFKPRDEIVEAIDALRRNTSVVAAMAHLNSVLTLQDGDFPLINGKPAWVAEKTSRPAPMF